MAKKPAIEVEGTKELRRIIKRIEGKEIKDAMKAANKGAAEVIAVEADRTVPVTSGSLQKSIRATGAQASGSVKVGSKAKVPYAGVIHYGWPARGIKPQPFVTEALQEKLGEARTIYEDLMTAVIQLLESKLS